MDHPPPKRPAPLVHAIWAGLLAVILVLAYLVFHEVSTAPERVARTLSSVAAEVAGKFRSEKITQTFRAEFPVFKSAGVGRLELGTSEAVETFQQIDSKMILWDTISLGETVSEIRVPVTYRYHIPLDDDWQLHVEGHTCVVMAPRVRPSLPPAIHTEKMEKRTSNGWGRFDKMEQLDALEKTITPRLAHYAGDPAHLEAVREECRQGVARFVRGWLLHEEQWRDDRLTSVVVIFPDEIAPRGNGSPTHWNQESPRSAGPK
jgi:hypothetical protein